MTSDTYFSGGEFDPERGAQSGVRLRVERWKTTAPSVTPGSGRNGRLGGSQPEPHRPGIHPDSRGPESQEPKFLELECGRNHLPNSRTSGLDSPNA